MTDELSVLLSTSVAADLVLTDPPSSDSVTFTAVTICLSNFRSRDTAITWPVLSATTGVDQIGFRFLLAGSETDLDPVAREAVRTVASVAHQQREARMPLLRKGELDELEACFQHEQSARAEWVRASIAFHRFIWAFAESLRIPTVLDWIERQLRRLD